MVQVQFSFSNGLDTYGVVHHITSGDDDELNGFRLKLEGGAGKALSLVRESFSFDGMHASLVGDDHVAVFLSEVNETAAFHRLISLAQLRRALQERGFTITDR